MFLDYETLRVIWWLLIGVLLIGFAIMDGFDLGLAIWLPFLGRSDVERRVMINCIGPTWEGNQVWFILGGGAIFAAWPMLYALSFSAFYLAMLLILLALILRPVGFKYRSKSTSPIWRSCWDWALFVGGFLPSLLFGVALGNVLQGLSFYIDDSLRPFYTGTFFDLLNPFAILCGLTSVSMLAMHGAFFMQTKTEGLLADRAARAGRFASLLLIALFAVSGLWLYYKVQGFALISPLAHDGPSNPLHKEVVIQVGAWLSNYKAYPLTQAVPAFAFIAAFLAFLLARNPRVAFCCSALSVACVIATVGVSMFPFFLPSSLVPNHSLLVWDSSSSHLTLMIMLIATLIFLPIVLTYTAWVYRVLRGKVNERSVAANHDSY